MQVLLERAPIVRLDAAGEAQLAAPHGALVGARGDAPGGERQRRRIGGLRARAAGKRAERERRRQGASLQAIPFCVEPSSLAIRTLASRPP